MLLIFYRRGADRTLRDYDNMLPFDYAEQRGHINCVNLLQKYHKRPLSATSQVALTPPTATPTLDEHGHVQLKNPTRRFSLTGESMTSFDRDRLPADGQAQSETSMVENTEVEDRGEGEGEHDQWGNSGQVS